MVLIAVAVMLGLWTLYSFTKEPASPVAQQGQTASGGAANQGAAARGGAEGGTAGAAGAGIGTSEAQQASGAPHAGEAAAGQSGKPEAGAGANAGATAGAPAGAPAGENGAPAAGANGAAGAAGEAPRRVNVLNNSTVQGLAKEVADGLGKDGFEIGEVGNFPDEILPETTVFFPKDDPAAEAAARELASKMGGVARENIDSLPEPVKASRSLTVVLAG